MSKIETGRYSERLRRALGMKGQELVAGDLSPEVSPVIVIEDNTAEWQFLQKVRLCSSVMLQGGVVAQNTIFRLRNPLASGVLATFKSFGFSCDVDNNSFNLGYGNTQAELAGNGTTAMRDGRWGRTPDRTTLIASRANGVGLNFQSSLWLTGALALTQVPYLHGDFLLLPGETLEFGTTKAQVDILITTTWTEREFPALER